jgi:hypothetical protein
MKILKLGEILRSLKKINDEIDYTDCFKSGHFTSGVIAFRPTKNPNPKQIEHTDKDVVCHVVKGTGRLCIKTGEFSFGRACFATFRKIQRTISLRGKPARSSWSTH